MLREHGAQRPTVFELLAHVHRLRGTKSKFSYNIPVPSPLSSRTQPEFKPSPSPNSLNSLVTYTSPPAKSALSLYDPHARSNQPPINQGIQARDKVLEAIAPMRRGRPDNSRESKNTSSSRPPSPQKISTPKQTNADKSKNWLDNDFGPEEDKVWKAATEQGISSSNHSLDLGWTIGDGQKPHKEKLEKSTGFGDNFAQELWNSSDPNSSGAVPPRLSPRPNLTTTAVNPNTAPIRPLAYTGGLSRTNQTSKDAFEGLGLMTTTSKPAPTMGEARKLRTGLAIVNTSIIPSDYKRYDTRKVSSRSRQPSLSPRQNYLSTTPSHPESVSPTPTSGTSNLLSPKLSSLPTSGSMVSTSRITNGPTIESRFPSLEELDARFIPSVNLLYPSSVIDASRNLSSQLTKNTESQSQLPSRANYIGSSGTGGNFLKPSITPNTSHSINGVRSEQVTGIAMREPKQSRKLGSEHSSSKIPPSDPGYSLLSPSPGDGPSRPVLVKQHQTTMSVKPGLDTSKSVESTEGTSYTKAINLEPARLPLRPSHSPSHSPSGTHRDWLTGDDNHGDIKIPVGGTSSEVPVLRSSPGKRSHIERNRVDVAASVATHNVIVHDQPSQEPLSTDLSPTVSKFKRTFPAIETIDTQDWRPSDASDLVDDWSAAAAKYTEQDSSSADEGPEDPKSLGSAALKKTSRAKGRQSSVHELVYQYGGGVVQKEKEHERERERVVQHNLSDYVPQQSKVRPSGLMIPTKPHMDRKTPSPTTKPPASPIGRSPQPHSSPKPSNKSQIPLKANKSPTSARPRPQSMFIFPTKSTDSSVPSPSLVPPEEESRQRATRRTSISDIVERYEAIGGKANLAGPPSPLPKPMTTRTTSIPPEPRRIQKTSISTSSSNVLVTTTSASNDSSHRSMGGDPSKFHSVSKEPPRQPVGLSRTPTKPRKSIALEKGELIHTHTVDSNIPRPLRISRKAEPFEYVVPPSAKVPFEAETSTPTKPPRKSTLFGTDLSSSKSEDRSPSPERPYQGVGKLIDQWQKKSAEADSQPLVAGKRAGFVPKRVGIVHGDDGRG